MTLVEKYQKSNVDLTPNFCQCKEDKHADDSKHIHPYLGDEPVVIFNAPDADPCQDMLATACGSGFMLCFYDPSFPAFYTVFPTPTSKRFYIAKSI